MEQDSESPHCYFNNNFHVSDGDVFIDVGCAEALSSLENVHIAKKLILFECNPIWEKPLSQTFRPYADKVKIVHQMIGDKTEIDYTTLDDALRDEYEENLFIKMDIEGYETKALAGAEKF